MSESTDAWARRTVAALLRKLMRNLAAEHEAAAKQLREACR